MQAAVLVRCEPHLLLKIRYTLETFLQTIGLRYRFVDAIGALGSRELLISYGRGDDLFDVPNKLVIPASPHAAAYFKRRVPYEATAVRMMEWEGRPIPLLFMEAAPARPCLMQDESHATVRLTFDLAASAFFFLSCWQEYVQAERDVFGRFPYMASLQSRLRIAQQPVVAEYLAVMKAALARLHGMSQQPFAPAPMWSGGRAWAICLTHDVHQLSKWTARRIWREATHGASLMLKHRHYAQGLRHYWSSAGSLLRRDNPLDPRLLLEQERRHGLHSSFYVMTGGSAPQDPPAYWRQRGPLQSLIHDIEEHGCEVGLHQSYETSTRPELLRLEKSRLDRLVREPAYGGRQHFLRFAVPLAWRLQQQAGLRYDSTLGFAEQPGFRAGFCFPYQPYDVERDEKLEIWELPLTVMDGTLRDYLRLTPQQAWETLKAGWRVTERHGGLCVLLWHTDFSGESPAWAPLYERILALAASGEVFAGSGAEIIDWWEARTRTLMAEG